MRFKNFKIVIGVLFVTISATAQKRVIDHTAYNDWKKNENQIVSNDGRFISYEINPHRGDGFLYLYDKEKNVLDSFPRGKEACLSSSNNYLAYKIVPGFDTLRNCELKKVDKKKWPKDTLAIYLFSTDSLIKIPMLKSFSVGVEHNWLSYTIDENEIKTVETKTDKKKKKSKSKNRKSKAGTEYKSDGKLFTVFDPLNDKKHQFKDVTDFKISENGNVLCFIEHKKEKVDSFQIQVLNLNSGEKSTIQQKFTSIKSLSFDKQADLLAFISSKDTTKVKTYKLNIFDFNSRLLTTIADTTSNFLKADKSPSEFRVPIFTDNGQYLFFGIGDRPEKEVKDTLLESEKVELDIWSYKDQRLQSQQVVELKTDIKKSDIYSYNLSTKEIFQISNDTLDVSISADIVGDYLLAKSDKKYLVQNQWEVPNREDHYRISLKDGSTELIKEFVGFDGGLSPQGNLYSYFDEKKGNFYLKELVSGKEVCMTCDEKNVDWQEDVNGMPMIGNPFGTLGYSPNEKMLYIQSKYDVWVFDIDKNKLNCLTQQEGKLKFTTLNLQKWNRDSIYIDYSNCYLHGFNEITKAASIYELKDHGDHTDIKMLMESDHKYTSIKRSKNKETVLIRKMSATEFPDLSILKSDFSNEKKISVTNPQQKDFNWTTVELVKWKSYDGVPLEGLLYKPENYDPSRKYPLVVYYYELNSENMHSHHVPKPTASIIHPTEYASAGYLIFIPDIKYKVGHPAKSAYDCIMSGTDYLLKKLPSIDSTRMGLQGQSWGGYQTAQLITMTNRYSAAMAGAPVANMFSAYGGIRWGTGINRQFQYERTQSRIGKTIWEAPELYIENSPLFHIPKIKTPLLIMANDKDGAVPWYQGIEMFTGMRRLGLPCWMLNYNGDDHNLMENANRFDLSIRMRQFFDHYLMGQPAPQWMTEGIPAVDKGKVLGY